MLKSSNYVVFVTKFRFYLKMYQHFDFTKIVRFKYSSITFKVAQVFSY